MEKANIKSYDTSPKIRYAWVDYAKFFSIFLVVSYHIPHRADGYVGELLSLLRMPAFFMIAGFLFNTNKFHSLSYFLKHRSIQLLIPYISFFTFFYISWLLFGRDWIGGNELDIPLWKPLMEFAYGTPVTIIAPYWFICCLFALQNYIIGCFKLYFKSIIEYGGYATNIILTLLTIIICCLPIKLINSYVPFLVGRGPYFEKKLK